MSDSAVSLLLALVEKVNASKYDMIVFTAMVDVLELKNDPMNRWRALIGRCSYIELADTDSPVFRQEVIEYLEGVAARERVFGVDIQTICERAGWSIRAALNALDMQERGEAVVCTPISFVMAGLCPDCGKEMTPGEKETLGACSDCRYEVPRETRVYDCYDAGYFWASTYAKSRGKRFSCDKQADGKFRFSIYDESPKVAQVAKAVEKPVSGEPTPVLDGAFINDALDQLGAKMLANGNDEGYATQVRRRIETVLSDCGIDSLTGIRREVVENWAEIQWQNGVRSARTINAYVRAVKFFSQHLVEIEVLPSNPLNAI